VTPVVLVVGASSGIGRATAHLLAPRVEHLVLASRGTSALEEAAEECRARGARDVEVLTLDVSDRAAVDEAVAGVVARHGRLDAVVDAASVVAYGRFQDVPPEVFEGVLRTNLLGAANLSRAVLPVFRRQRAGHLLLIGSVLGEVNVPAMTPYVVSKWALRSLGRQLALENRDLPDVHVTVVSPGGVDTPIYRQAANYQGKPGRPPAPVVSPTTVAKALVQALDRPRDRVSVGIANPLMRFGFAVLPSLFDRLVGPLFSVLATRPGSQAPTTGNVLEPYVDLEAVTGGEDQGLRDALARIKEG
jgi:short-subunit dehydrogenase